MTHAEMDRIISEWYYEAVCDKWIPTMSPLWGYRKSEDCGHKHCIAKQLYPRRFSEYNELWTPELFSEIEERGLVEKFSLFLSIYCGASLLSTLEISPIVWYAAKSTPEQKALALVRAIQEGK